MSASASARPCLPAEPAQQPLYHALGLDGAPGGIRKMVQ
jgi:hypothetical protein